MNQLTNSAPPNISLNTNNSLIQNSSLNHNEYINENQNTKEEKKENPINPSNSGIQAPDRSNNSRDEIRTIILGFGQSNSSNPRIIIGNEENSNQDESLSQSHLQLQNQNQNLNSVQRINRNIQIQSANESTKKS